MYAQNHDDAIHPIVGRWVAFKDEKATGRQPSGLRLIGFSLIDTAVWAIGNTITSYTFSSASPTGAKIKIHTG